MCKEYRNIYQICRESKGITQEKAAELLNVSVESIRAYEGDKRIPPNDIVAKMVEVYDTQYLAFQHLKNSELGTKYLPNVEEEPLPIAILKLQKELKKLPELIELLIDIGSDGKITELESPDWQRLVNTDFSKIVDALLSVKYAKQEK